MMKKLVWAAAVIGAMTNVSSAADVVNLKVQAIDGASMLVMLSSLAGIEARNCFTEQYLGIMASERFDKWYVTMDYVESSVVFSDPEAGILVVCSPRFRSTIDLSRNIKDSIAY